jgi:hypothetical protein
MRQRGRRKDGQPMATTEAGGGVPQELRDRLVDRFLAKPIPTHWMSTRTSWGNDVVYAILAEIAAAGYELVESDRMREMDDAFGECFHDLNECRGLPND